MTNDRMEPTTFWEIHGDWDGLPACIGAQKYTELVEAERVAGIYAQHPAYRNVMVVRCVVQRTVERVISTVSLSDGVSNG